MKKYFGILAALFLVGCIAGEDGQNGEDGRNGRDGKDAKSHVYTGILYAADTTMNGPAIYWDKPYSTITDSSIVNVWVRQGAGYMWIQPTWYLGAGYVRIIDDENANPAYEYKIVIAN